MQEVMHGCQVLAQRLHRTVTWTRKVNVNMEIKIVMQEALHGCQLLAQRLKRGKLLNEPDTQG